jgi:hypothetical protein
MARHHSEGAGNQAVSRRGVIDFPAAATERPVQGSTGANAIVPSARLRDGWRLVPGPGLGYLRCGGAYAIPTWNPQYGRPRIGVAPQKQKSSFLGSPIGQRHVLEVSPMKVHRVVKRAASAGSSGHGQAPPDPGSRNMVSSVMSPLPVC